MPLSVVTGAGHRVGQAIAAALAGAGFDVVCCVHRSSPDDTVRAIEAFGRKAWVERADLAQAEDVDALADRLRGAHPRIDVVVNNAGVFEEVPFDSITRAQWRSMLAINLEAPFFLTQRLMPSMTHGGVIVNVTDVAAERPMNRHAHYNVSKAGLAMMTKSLAVELAPKIRVCAVAPGTVAFPPNYDDEEQRRVLARVPLRRAGSPEDVASAVVFLVRSPYLTGVTIHVDGGRGAVL